MSLFGSIRDGVKGAKNSMLQGMIHSWVNTKIQKMGTLTDLQMDPENKLLSLELQLIGEVTSVRIERAQYELIEKGEKTYIVFHQMVASREWINVGFEEFVKGKPFEIPSAARMALG